MTDDSVCDIQSPAIRTVAFLERFESKVRQLKQNTETISKIYNLEIADHVLQLHFLNTDMDKNYIASLGYVLRNQSAKPEDILYIWTDYVGNYISENICNSNRRWLCQSCDATVTGSLEYGYISARRHNSNITYLCLSNDNAYGNMFTSHPFINEMNWWARVHRLFLVHSAAVGIDGQGILISAFGGSGKTTLALACLLYGMEYVADDYLLLDQDKSRMAYPIYATGYIIPDSLELLPQLKKCAIGRNKGKKNKTLIDLSPYFSQFAPCMDIKAIVFPVVSNSPNPSIEKIPSTQPIIQMAYSTAIQNREEKNVSFIRELLECVKSLPAYKINLSRNVFDNAELVEKLVNELK